jgi:hypothetical protein
MKKITSLILGAFSVLLVDAQTQIVDLSTGVSTYHVGYQLYDYDSIWTVQKPGSSTYQPVGVGNGKWKHPGWSMVDYSVIPTLLSPTYPSPKWLSPHLWATDNYQLPRAGQFYSPELLDSPTNEDGYYIYKMSFQTNNTTACFIPTEAQIKVKILTGLGRAEELIINGYSYPLSNFVPSVPNIPWIPMLNDGGDLLSLCESYNLNPSNYLPSNYTIPVHAFHLHNGTNYIYVKVKKETYNSITPAAAMASGFLCSAKLEIKYGGDPAYYPNIDIAGTVGQVVNSAINATLKNVGGSFTIEIYSDANLTQQVFSTNVSAIYPFPVINVPITVPNPLLPANYYLVAYNNNPNHPGCKLVMKIPLGANYGVSNSNSNSNSPVRNVTGTPVNDENLIADTKIKWSVEELDAFTGESLFMIDNPECWEASNAVGASNTFNGFNYENEYSGLVTTIPCNGDPGVFATDRVYRITRSYKIMDEEWESSSFMIGPGYDDLHDEKRTSATLVGEVDSDLFNLAHDRENDQMQLISSIDFGTIEVLDVLGNKMIGIDLQPEQFNYVLSTKGFAAGVYVVSLKSGNQILTKKFMVE